MFGHYLNIESKSLKTVSDMVGLSNFSTTEGEAVSADVVLNKPNISLYCLDDQEKRAIFTELPPDIDLGKAPFVGDVQFDYAQRLIAVPYEVFRTLADRLPAVTQPILIYTPGRSGSTLLHNAFNELDTVFGLSEPDTIAQIVYLRAMDNQRDAELQELIECAVRIFFKPTVFKKPTTYALKFRDDALEIMDLLQAVFPHAKNIFLYRDAATWVASYYHIFKRTDVTSRDRPMDRRLAVFKQFFNSALGEGDIYPLENLMALVEELQISSDPDASRNFEQLAAYLDPEAANISTVQILTLWWLYLMEWYLSQTARQISVLPVRYAELNAYPEKTLTEIFRYCGLPISQVKSALAALARDSQKGTALARDNPGQGNQIRLSNQQIAEIARILSRHPVIKTTDFTVPGTLCF